VAGFYAMVKNQVEYDQTIWEKRDAQRRKRHTASLKRQTERFRYRLTPIQEQTAAYSGREVSPKCGHGTQD